MNWFGLFQIALYLVVLVLLVKPLGAYMARVYAGDRVLLERALGPVERGLYRLGGRHVTDEMSWKTYAVAFVAFHAAGLIVTYALQRVQGWLPLNPDGMAAVPPDLAFNTAISFATNTNWQAYGGETTMSYFTQMLGLTVQNFVSAASGIAVLVALTRGFFRRTVATIGNFWVDLVRTTLYVLLPLAFFGAILLASQGVVQTLSGAETATLSQAAADSEGHAVTEQTIARGPAASQISIKQLGTNGGGFFNVNSAHPFENPTPFANFAEVVAILVISAALCYTFGRMIGRTRQGWVLLAAMLVIFIPLLLLTYFSEQRGNPTFSDMGVNQTASADQSGGNMEGKEVRFGISASATWAAATTAASNGSVNSMHDSFTPLGGLVPLWLMQLGEVIFGGVGSGLYGLLAFAVVAVFIAGLMVGRTPEFLGKKIEAHEVKLASLIILVPAASVLLGTAVAVLLSGPKSSVLNPGAHGFSEILYAFSSASNNNGSAFAGLTVNTPFYNYALGTAMLLGRFVPAISAIALAGALARKKLVPASAGTLPTDSVLFVILLAGTVIIVGALTFLPALFLGPVVEQLLLY